MDFTILSVNDDILSRLFESRYHLNLFEKMAQEYNENNYLQKTKVYSHSPKSEQEKMLRDLASKCTELPAYRDYNSQQVILHMISGLDDDGELPANQFRRIFGHVENEKSIYGDVSDFEGWHVVDTYSRRSPRSHVRYADFTIVKKRLFGGFEIRSLDVKVTCASFKTFLNQTNDFLIFSDYAYLITTPGLVLDASTEWGIKPIRAQETFENRLKRNKTGLYVYDLTSGRAKLLVDPTSSFLSNDQLQPSAKGRALAELGFKR